MPPSTLSQILLHLYSPTWTETCDRRVSLEVLNEAEVNSRRIAQMTEALLNAHIPRMVNSQPFPIAEISGAPTIPPTQLKMFRTKLFRATPEDDL
jgi:hypothetical protein